MCVRIPLWVGLLLFISQSVFAQSQDTYVVLISLDGYRYDYTERFRPENIQRISKEGVTAEGLIPAFPSKTFPNHYSIATGMLPEFHGLVDNTFVDPELEGRYSVGRREAVQDPSWYGGTPLWVLAEQNGLKAASYFFVGTEAPVQGIQPSYFYNYDAQVSNLSRVSKVFEWLELPEPERPRLITLYFSDMDDVGHRYGPQNDSKLRPKLEKLDREMGALMEGLKSLDLDIQVVVVSDHGMAAVPKQQLLALDELLEGIDAEVANNGALAHIYLNEGADLEAVQQLLRSRGSHYQVVKPDDPGFYTPNAPYTTRLGDLLVVPDLGFYLATGADMVRYQNRAAMFTTDTFGEHGFSPEFREMHGIFYAWGSKVKPGLQIPAFQNVHVYPLVCHLLGLDPPAGVQGELRVLQGILLDEDGK
ncbi:MAG: alkaline phosphatase family protein [Lunatimonas sp.]|uniref:alkaline phosphatase family protein n=1 Tax=Lunatimonas sp. TaxID=2060141 RepID=UPI00263BB3A0|nr:ectonucleotide pyrophosphatase/phosphodiesterase [Lunatimonas sp.]MCC5937881.1 alkaline phosphatase family protein [Lunatimonas sp.]